MMYNNHDNWAVAFNLKINPCTLMDQTSQVRAWCNTFQACGAPCISIERVIQTRARTNQIKCLRIKL